jgi:hypothetical protein
LINVALISIHDTSFANNAAGVERFNIAVDGTLVGVVTVASIILAGLFYLSLPKIEVKLVKGYFYNYMKEEQLALRIAWGDGGWQTVAEARAGLQETISNPTNAAVYGLKGWDNYLVSGQVHEEDSPGNYLLCETNNQLQLITFNPDGGEEIFGTWDLRT